MAKGDEKTPVKGGWVKRDAEAGRFLAVCSSSGVSRTSPISEQAVQSASSRRNSALKRLADR